MLASPPDQYGYSDEPRFRWVKSTWSYEEPQAHMKKWDERYRKHMDNFKDQEYESKLESNFCSDAEITHKEKQ